MEKLRITPAKIPGNQSLQTECQNTEEQSFCDKHGSYDKFRESFSGKMLKMDYCPECREEEVEQEAIDRKRRERETKIKYLHGDSNVPKRFRCLDINKINTSYHKSEEDNSKLEHTVNIVKRYLETYEDRLKNGASGFFSGECGTGKTMLACMMVESIINQGHSAHYVTAWQMIQEIRQGYKKTIDEGIQYFIKEYINKSFLVVDEIGVQHGTEDERILLYQVIDGRYNEVKPTVLISNSKNPVEDGYLDLRTIDRLKEGGGFSITFTGESFRK